MTTANVRRLAVGAVCTGLGLAGVCVTPASAADGSGFAVGGSPWSLQTDVSKAPSLTPGWYSAKLPAESKTWYFKVSRKSGERLQIGFTGQLAWKNGAWLSSADSSETDTLSISTANGQQCQSQNVPIPGNTRSGAMPSSYLFIDPTSNERNKNTSQDSDACRTATNFTVSVQRSVTGSDSLPMPAQLSVVTVPAVKTPPQRPGSDSLAPMDTSSLSAKEKVTPGHGYADAPALTPAGYTVDAVPGQVSFVKVHLSEGQRLSVGWEAPANGSGASVAQDMMMTGFIVSPGLANAFLTSGSAAEATLTPSTMGTQSIGMYTAPVNYSNTDLSVDKNSNNAWFATDPGWYYVAFRMAPTDASGKKEGLKSTKAIPTTLSLRVQGQAEDGPAMDVAQPQAGKVSGAPTSSRVATPVWASLAVLGALAVGAVAFIMRRRSAS